MTSIPEIINGVAVEFSANVVNSVDQKIADALHQIIKQNISAEHTLTKTYISSARDQHTLPSRHMQGEGKAIDISRINGMKMSMHYPSDAAVKSIVDAIQLEFENYAHRRENFGPFMKMKSGNNYNVSRHNDHIHISVN